MTNHNHFFFSGTLWQYTLTGGWHFVTLPQELSGEIRAVYKSDEKGWGQLAVKTKVGETEWDTAIWFDTKANSYLLPIKAGIRKKEKLSEGMEVRVVISI